MSRPRKSARTAATTSAAGSLRGPAGTVAAACSAAMKPSRSARSASASPPAVNNSSNWSTTSTSRGGAQAAASAGPPGPGVRDSRPAAVLTACSTSIGASPGAADSDRYTDTGSAPATSASCIASSRNGLPVGRITRRGHRCDPGPSAPAASRGINPARSSEDLPAPDSPATSSIPGPVQPPGKPLHQLVRQLAAPVKNPRVPLLERHQPQIRAPRPHQVLASRRTIEPPDHPMPLDWPPLARPPAPPRPGRGRGPPPRTRHAPARPGPARRPAARRCPCGRCG